METHIEENVHQHMILMCSLVSKQQQQISSLKSALNKVTLNYSGMLNLEKSEFSQGHFLLNRLNWRVGISYWSLLLH